MFFFCFIFKRFILFYAYLDWHFGCKVNCNHMQYSYTFKNSKVQLSTKLNNCHDYNFFLQPVCIFYF